MDESSSAMTPASPSLPATLPRWRVFPPLALGTLMATLDISVVNIALPTLSRSFGVPLTTIEWVVLAYVVTITGSLLAFGRLADTVGRRRIYGIGLGVFTAASALCAVAPGAHGLIAARALQGLGAAMMTANSSALLIANFPAAERGRAIGAFGAMVGVGLAVGPPLGGLVIAHLSWRWIFLINLPAGVLAQWLLWRRVPADAPAEGSPGLDLAAASLWCGALVCVMLAASRGPASCWQSASVWPWIAAGTGLLAGFVIAERRSATPLLPLSLLAGPLGAAVTLTFLANALSFAVGFHLPLYLEEVLGFDAARSGRWMAMLPLAALLFAPAAGRWSDRIGPRPLATAGMALTALGFVLLARLGVSTPAFELLGGMALIGVGQGIFTVPNASALLSAVPSEQLGLASGLQATMRNLGFATGSASMAAIVTSRYATHGGAVLAASHQHRLLRPAFAAATRDAYALMAAVAVIGSLLAWRRRDPAHGRGRP